jgi:predicted ABC-type ATPase
MAVVYHYRHGWIKLDHPAAKEGGIKSRKDVAGALKGLHAVPAGDRSSARSQVLSGAAEHGAHDLLPGHHATPPLSGGQLKDLRGDNDTSAAPHLVTDAYGNTHFTPERQALHDKIIEGIVAGHQKQEFPAFVMLGGGPASGKTKAADAAEHEFPGAIKIDPDAIKGMLPEYHAEKDRNKAAAHVHEESSYLAKRAQAEALKTGAHVVLDAVGNSNADSVKAKISQAREAGYSAHARYVTVPTDVAQARAHERGVKSGRVVGPEVIQALHSGVSQVFPSVVDHFDTAALFDNSGTTFTQVLSKTKGGQVVVHDPAAYKSFIAKAHEGAPSAPAAKPRSAALIDNAVRMHGSNRSAWSTTNLRAAAKLGDSEAKQALASRR